jgi:hypothetical protein
MSISLAVSLVYQDREPTRSAQAGYPQTGFVSTPSLATPVETFHPTSLLRYTAALAGSVVATDSASVDADCDNGAALSHEGGERWRDGDTDSW